MLEVRSVTPTASIAYSAREAAVPTAIGLAGLVGLAGTVWWARREKESRRE
jgi:hypothetical protein